MQISKSKPKKISILCTFKANFHDKFQSVEKQELINDT
jgi:hypothetical protein